MMTQTEAKRLVRNIFQEHALVLGGLAALDEIDDDAIWRLVRSLDTIRLRAIRRIEHFPVDPGRPEPRPAESVKPHPAIEQFLRQIQEDAA
jgi:hypothetical protein